MPKTPERETETLDIRVVEHAIRRGNLTREDYEAHLASLPDETEESEPSVIPFTAPYAQRLAREKKG